MLLNSCSTAYCATRNEATKISLSSPSPFRPLSPLRPFTQRCTPQKISLPPSAIAKSIHTLHSPPMSLFENFWLKPLSQRIIILSKVIIPLLILLCAYPTYRYINTLRSHVLLKQSIQSAESEKGIYAFQKALSAHHLNRNNATIHLNLARRAAEINHLHAIAWWEHILDHPERTPDDLQLYLELLIVQGEFSLARSTFARYSDELPEDLPKWKTYLHFLKEDKRFYEAYLYIKQLIEQGNDTWFLHHSLWRYSSLLMTQDATKHAVEHLLTLTERKDETGIKTMRLLLGLGSLNAQQQRDLLPRFIAHPLIERNDLLLQYSIEFTLGIKTYLEVRQQMAKHFDLTENRNLRLIASWLSAHNMSEETLELVEIEQAEQDRDLYWKVLLSTIESGDPQTAFDLTLQDGNINPLNSLERMAGRARAYKAMGAKRQFEESMRETVESINLINYQIVESELLATEAWNMLLLLYQRLADNPSTKKTGWFKLMMTHYQLGNEQALFRLLTEYTIEDFQGEPTVQNFIAYLNLIYQNDVDSSRRVLERLFRDYPNIIAFRITLALAYQQSEAAPLATPLLKDIQTLPTFKGDRPLLITYALLTPPNQRSHALNQKIETLTQDNLLGREQRLLAQVLHTVSQNN